MTNKCTMLTQLTITFIASLSKSYMAFVVACTTPANKPAPAISKGKLVRGKPRLELT